MRKLFLFNDIARVSDTANAIDSANTTRIRSARALYTFLKTDLLRVVYLHVTACYIFIKTRFYTGKKKNVKEYCCVCINAYDRGARDAARTAGAEAFVRTTCFH